MTTPDRFQRVDDVFRAALRRPESERRAFVADLCATDADLERDVLSLLEADAGAEGFLGDRPVPPAPPLPESVGPYRITRLIGEGGMGTVYEARQATPRRVVALKVMKRGLTSPSALRRFEYEAQILGRLRHPGIAQIYEAGAHDGVPYFAMEYVPNARALDDYLAERTLDLDERLALFAEICAAVHHGHQRGIIHRDLKPANILVDSTGAPRIIDFGVARATDADLAVTTAQTGVGQLVGTLQYMSPEQCDADPHDLDIRSDVYTLGVILYEMLCDAPPYDVGETVHTATKAIRSTPPRRPSTVRAQLAGDLETILLTALDKDRDRRYASAAALGSDLQRFRQGQPIEARPPSVVYQMRLFARRHRPLVAALGVAVVGLVLASAVSVGFGLVAVAAQHEAETERDAARDARKAEADARARAERRFNESRSLTNTFLFEVDEELVTVPGATAARELIVSIAIEHLDRLAADAGDDVDLRLDIASACNRIASIQGHPLTPNLGRTDDAIASYERGIAISDPVLVADPDDLRALTVQMALHRARARTLLAANRTADAIAGYERAAELGEHAIAVAPDDVDVRYGVATVHALIGDRLYDAGRIDEALKRFQRSYDHVAAGAEGDDDEDRARRQVGIACIDMGKTLMRRGDEAEAMTYFERCLELRRTRVEAAPDDRRALGDLVSIYSRLGMVHTGRDEFEVALRYYLDALAISERLAEADANDIAAIERLSIMQERAGGVLLAMDRPVEARAMLERCVEGRRRWVATQPNRGFARVAFGVALERLADVDRDLGATADAMAGYRSALTELEAALSSGVQSALAHSARCFSAFKLAELHEARADDPDREAALRAQERARARDCFAIVITEIESAKETGRQLYGTPASLDELRARRDRLE